MASQDYSPNSPSTPSDAITSQNKFFSSFTRSISTKEASFSQFPYTPPRRSANDISLSFSQTQTQNPSASPCFIPALKHPELLTAYRCISSVLKKDGQILSIAASNGLVYSGSYTNVIRVWKLPEFTECGQLKTKACMVVALEVSHDRVYAAYGDGRVRIWQRTWDGGLKHERLATIPKIGSYVRSFYIAGKDKTVIKY